MTIAKNLIVYFRVSSATQAREESVERQIENFEKVKDQFKDYDLIEREPGIPYFIDNPFNLESIAQGTAIHEVVQHILRLPPGSITLWISEMDRLTRANSDEVRGLLTDLIRFKKVTIYTKFGIETSSDLLMAIQSAICADDKRKGTRKCHEGKLTRIKTEGRPPTGFTPGGLEFNKRTKKWSLVEYEINIRKIALGLAIGKVMDVMPESIAHIARLNPRGISDAEISTVLNTNGYSMLHYYERVGRPNLQKKNPTGRFTEGMVANLLRDDNYRGTIKYYLRSPEQVNNPAFKTMSREEKTLFTIEVPRVFSDDEWLAYRAVRVSRQEKAKNNAKHEYLVRGPAHCALCDNKLTARPRFMKGKWYLYYICQRRVKVDGSRCSAGRYHDAQEFDKTIWEILRGLILDDAYLEAIESIRGGNKGETTTPELLQGQIALIAAQLEKMKSERLRTIGLFTKGAIAEDDMRELLTPLDQRQNSLKRDRERLEAKLHTLEHLPTGPKCDLGQLRKLYHARIDSLDFEDRRSIAETILDRIQLWPDGTFKVLLRPFQSAPKPENAKLFNAASSGELILGEVQT